MRVPVAKGVDRARDGGWQASVLETGGRSGIRRDFDARLEAPARAGLPVPGA